MADRLASGRAVAEVGTRRRDQGLGANYGQGYQTANRTLIKLKCSGPRPVKELSQARNDDQRRLGCEIDIRSN